MSFYCPHRGCIQPSPCDWSNCKCRKTALNDAINRLARHLVPAEQCPDCGQPLGSNDKCFECFTFEREETEEEKEPTADEMEEWDHERREKLARDLEY